MDYLVLRAFIENIPHNLEVPGEMDKFLEGLTHCDVLRSDCHLDRKSTDPDRLRKYTQGQIVTTLTTLLHTHKLSNGVPVPPKPALLPPGRGLSSQPSHFG